ncbi:hypothetical protein JKP88DRAFT_350842 [Tribonema minus]|uniref:Myb-like domain-containing protein n=1 Tax=Tribonema minus TaxID=303371 RepID=A0A836CA89_9STRA|nr:hypothetical protein JKP88DRAFT_350842 [Tribonema minus]
MVRDAPPGIRQEVDLDVGSLGSRLKVAELVDTLNDLVQAARDKDEDITVYLNKARTTFSHLRARMADAKLGRDSRWFDYELELAKHAALAVIRNKLKCAEANDVNVQGLDCTAYMTAVGEVLVSQGTAATAEQEAMERYRRQKAHENLRDIFAEGMGRARVLARAPAAAAAPLRLQSQAVCVRRAAARRSDGSAERRELRCAARCRSRARPRAHDDSAAAATAEGSDWCRLLLITRTPAVLARAFIDRQEGVISVMKLNALLHENELSTLMANIMTLCRHLDDSLDKPRLPMIYGRGLKPPTIRPLQRGATVPAPWSDAMLAADDGAFRARVLQDLGMLNAGRGGGGAPERSGDAQQRRRLALAPDAFRWHAGRASSAQKRSKAAAAAAAAATAAADGLAAPLLPTVAAAAAGAVKKRGADETETDDEAKGGGGKGKGKAKRPRAEGEAGVPPTPDEAKRLRAAREAAEAVVHNRRGLSTVEQALAEAPSPARPVAVQKRLKLRRSTKENVKNAKAKASPPSPQRKKGLKRAIAGAGGGSSAESDDGYASSSSSGDGAVVVVSVKRNGPLDWASHSDSEFESDELVEEEDDEEPEVELEPEEAEEGQGGAAEGAEGGGGAEGQAGLGAPETPGEGGKPRTLRAVQAAHRRALPPRAAVAQRQSSGQRNAPPPPQKRITLSRSPGEQRAALPSALPPPHVSRRVARAFCKVDWTDSQSVDEPLASPGGAAGAIARMGEAQAPGERWVKPLKKTVASGSRGRRFWAASARAGSDGMRGPMPCHLRAAADSRSSTARHQPTKEEEGYLRDGVKIYGEGRWAVILEAYPFENRTSVNLKDKWRNITKSDAATARASAAQDAAANGDGGDGGGGLALLGDGSAPPALRPLAPRVLLPGIGLPLAPSPLQLGAAPGAAAGFAPPPLLPQQPPQQQQGLEPPEGGGGAAEGAGAGDGVAPLGMSAAGASNIAQV